MKCACLQVLIYLKRWSSDKDFKNGHEIIKTLKFRAHAIVKSDVKMIKVQAV